MSGGRGARLLTRDRRPLNGFWYLIPILASLVVSIVWAGPALGIDRDKYSNPHRDVNGDLSRGNVTAQHIIYCSVDAQLPFRSWTGRIGGRAVRTCTDAQEVSYMLVNLQRYSSGSWVTVASTERYASNTYLPLYAYASCVTGVYRTYAVESGVHGTAASSSDTSSVTYIAC